MKLALLVLATLPVVSAAALEPAEVHGIWQLEIEESVLRLRDKPQGKSLDREEARRWVEERAAARLVITDQKIGITLGDSQRFFSYKRVEVDVYKVIFRIETGGRQGRIEFTRKGGDLWVYTSTLTPYWNWSVWQKPPLPQSEEDRT